MTESILEPEARTVHIESIDDLLTPIKEAGQMALDAQREAVPCTRDYKPDGSVVTETDRRVEVYLYERITALYPGANVLTEETARTFDPQSDYTFAVDPIDGTDSFSQGWVGWCTSVGLLDGRLRPAAGIVYAPVLGLLFYADVGERATLNGERIRLPPGASFSLRSNVYVASRVHRQIDLRRLPAKIRSIGSAALHLCLPLIYPGVCGAIEGAGIHVWDVAGAHAINLSVGWDVGLLGGGGVNYWAMADGDSAGDVVLAGSAGCIKRLRSALGVEVEPGD
jgi:myo-inositol-1(or 4)-monophosphatase